MNPRGVATAMRQQSEPTRDALRDLRQSSPRPMNAVVALEVGLGHEPAELARALKALKKQMESGGAFREIKRRAFYQKPSERARLKSLMARRRTIKAKAKAARREAWEVMRGL